MAFMSGQEQLGENFRIDAVPPQYAAGVLKYIEEWLEEGRRRGGVEWEFDKVLADVKAGRLQLWVGVEGTRIIGGGLTEIVEVDDGESELWVYTVGGDGVLKYIDQVVEFITDFAKSVGCKRFAFWGRPGWQRALKDRGFTLLAVRLGKRVE